MGLRWSSEGAAMQVYYKHNGRDKVYEDLRLPTIPRDSPEPPPRGPFGRCAGCPYSGHGFICWHTDGKCLRTEMARIMKRDKSVGFPK